MPFIFHPFVLSDDSTGTVQMLTFRLKATQTFVFSRVIQITNYTVQ